ncbi:NAD(FAD)-utilizing dehydrogenase, putative [Psychroflexus torquis ATCC 700755]|uniref:NAD(FAD)-utilizing dehydrogenase, putative n=1 Tax=Psychroflexus torquis (strain ATCC 700755 / CIP 106069 / ACAM 623) TaxID=313595 RepID=K4INJ8_PSYTT|nr:FAD-binding protein [Psychroflexus torquis]AFU67120.1 NAD(FAD)-utilizing dehydrogenase, putative [Psychroflexus torquis ATCC 700755]
MPSLPHHIDIRVNPEVAHDTEGLKKAITQYLDIPSSDLLDFKILKRSIDARARQIKFQLRIAYYSKGEEVNWPSLPVKKYQHTNEQSPKVIVVGSGPAGLYAALKLLEKGLKPVVIERGKEVRARRRDLAKINKEHLVNPESNYCFGEGGAGTYSDGKLYTRSGHKKAIKEVLEIFVEHGASEDILVDAHPHIGTNKLPNIITKMRETILEFGGEIHFNSKLTDFIIDKDRLTGVEINQNLTIYAEACILATGHSARDIFYLLHDRNIKIEFKTFAMGVRVEHPQSLIDQIQYKKPERGEYLPPSAYSLVEQVDDKGVYSFCMCPGGIIAPCATSPGEVVTNGWSPSKRNNPYGNSGIVVTVDDEQLEDYKKYGPLKGLKFQEYIEKKCWALAGESQNVPAQRLQDFIKKRKSDSIPKNSYQPGTTSVEMDTIFPETITKRLRQGFINFTQKMKGFDHPDAVILAPESRTSSPVRIPRDKDTLEHPDLKGLYPCGEGAGYAGGIVSAALDGERCANAIAKVMMDSPQISK